MGWLGKLFGGKPAGREVGPAANPANVKTLRPARDLSRPEAKRITTENVAAYCDRLEREADRTGNARLRQQAQNIRARLGA